VQMGIGRPWTFALVGPAQRGSHLAGKSRGQPQRETGCFLDLAVLGTSPLYPYVLAVISQPGRGASVLETGLRR
jgi:hypothetical protein